MCAFSYLCKCRRESFRISQHLGKLIRNILYVLASLFTLLFIESSIMRGVKTCFEFTDEIVHLYALLCLSIFREFSIDSSALLYLKKMFCIMLKRFWTLTFFISKSITLSVKTYSVKNDEIFGEVTKFLLMKILPSFYYFYF